MKNDNRLVKVKPIITIVKAPVPPLDKQKLEKEK